MILYTAQWCSPCKALKQWIEATGNGEGVEIVDVDDASVEVPKDIRTIPVLDVDGSRFVGNEEIRPFLSQLNEVDVEL
tara:strand:+ start:176 stop:409 length:234 start_codon:yes stop_codon:yes gene_type:complete